MTLPRPAALLACLLLSAVPAAAQDAGEAGLDPGIARDELDRHDVPTGPLRVFAAVETAWADGDADALMELLDPDEKVSLAFSKGGLRGGRFNRDQAYFLLKDLLEFSRTERFEFEKYWNLEEGGRTPYAVAVHDFRMNDGASHSDQVYISL
ncbi:MAG TPA: hypothetical protein VKU85_16595, partial [bacterium]|nr:hypothetical protein [bacterium]